MRRMMRISNSPYNRRSVQVQPFHAGFISKRDNTSVEPNHPEITLPFQCGSITYL